VQHLRDRAGRIGRVVSQRSLRGAAREQRGRVGTSVADLQQGGRERWPRLVGDDLGGPVGQRRADPSGGVGGRAGSPVDGQGVKVLRDNGIEPVRGVQRLAQLLCGREFGAFAADDRGERGRHRVVLAVPVEQVARQCLGFVGGQHRLGVEVAVVLLGAA
jgi:hypothetical protein